MPHERVAPDRLLADGAWSDRGGGRPERERGDERRRR